MKDIKLQKKRYEDELKAIQEEYASGKYRFKKGDIVIFKRLWDKTSTRCVISTMHYLSPETIFKYRHENLSDNIEISGEVVDEDGYYIPFFKGGNQTIGEKFRAEDVIEVTNIRPKMSFR